MTLTQIKFQKTTTQKHIYNNEIRSITCPLYGSLLLKIPSLSLNGDQIRKDPVKHISSLSHAIKMRNRCSETPPLYNRPILSVVSRCYSKTRGNNAGIVHAVDLHQVNNISEDNISYNPGKSPIYLQLQHNGNWFRKDSKRENQFFWVDSMLDIERILKENNLVLDNIHITYTRTKVPKSLPTVDKPTSLSEMLSKNTKNSRVREQPKPCIYNTKRISVDEERKKYTVPIITIPTKIGISNFSTTDSQNTSSSLPNMFQNNWFLSQETKPDLDIKSVPEIEVIKTGRSRSSSTPTPTRGTTENQNVECWWNQLVIPQPSTGGIKSSKLPVRKNNVDYIGNIEDIDSDSKLNSGQYR